MHRSFPWLLVAGLAAPRLAVADKVAVAEPPPHPTAAGTPGVRAHAARRAGDITIDGRLDDPGWADVTAVSGFLERFPNEGGKPSHDTEFKVVYDDSAIYVAIRCFDDEPDKIRATLTRRDESSPSDWVVIGLDSYHDRRTAFLFGINAAGVQQDSIVYDDSNQDNSWDAVWSGAAAIDAKGWTAEIRIPLSQLRFSPGRDDWGFQIYRVVGRSGEESTWSYWPRSANGTVVSRFGTLDSITGLKPSRRIEILPYASTGVALSHPDPADPFGRATDGRYNGGVDLKYGLTSAFTLAATINPDFGQVDADPSLVNLSGLQTFFPEKRPFFLEGTDIFQWSLQQQGNGGGGEGLFYTRRIGAAPHLFGTDYADYADQPEATKIYGAAKISGKTDGGWSLGALEAVTGEEVAKLSDPHMPALVVEPLTNYGLLRVRKDLREGRTTIAGIITSVDRKLDTPEVTAALHDHAVTGGLDLAHRWHKDEWEVDGKLYGSYVHGSTDAILSDQTSLIRLYQRPDATHVHVDPTRRSLGGGGLLWDAGRWNNQHVNFGVGGDIRTPGLELNDIGFQNNADQILQWAWAGYRNNDPGDRVINWNAEANVWSQWNWEPLLEGNGLSSDINATLANYWTVATGVNLDHGTWNPQLLRGGKRYRAENHGNVWVNLGTDQRKPVSANFNVFVNRRPESDSWSGGASAMITVQARSNVELSLGPDFSVQEEAHQYVGQPSDAMGATHYVFARLHEVVTDLTLRGSWTFSPTLTLQVYAQPFIAAGSYSGYMEPADTYSDAYRRRWHLYAPHQVSDDGSVIHIDPTGDGSQAIAVSKPDFDVRDFHSNVVLRWEYRPGSTIYLVWSHARESSESEGQYQFGHDVGQLARERGEHVVMLKANYWIGL